ncbi:DUF2169 family type VI secretion system accessory protein [Marivivens marinus]|uniref:DUF2169 family type VI secretion system accessory protein n=1 Tax=Marivivens marinus TaxID=3110173 RepID=UPI003B8467DD
MSMHIENLTSFPCQFTLAFDSAGREMVVVVTKGTYTLPEAPGDACTLSPAQRPLHLADEIADGLGSAILSETDFAPTKPFCDVMVSGPACTPGGEEVKRLLVAAQLGKMKKSFHVLGPRAWQGRMLGVEPSEPKPFSVQEISYQQAWGGGEQHPRKEDIWDTVDTNPAGVGYYPYSSRTEGKPLPNTEEVGKPVLEPVGTYVPMAFGPIGRAWLPRRTFAGTYDKVWQDTRMPFPPTDLDPRYFQSTPPDQQIRYPTHGEAFSLVGLSPRGPIHGVLPAPKVTMRFERKTGRMTQRIAQPDTVVFYPSDHQLTITWRTHLKPDRDIFDLSQVVVEAQ